MTATSSTTAPVVFDRRLLAVRRNRSAPVAARHAFLLERAADDIADRLEAVRRTFGTAVVTCAHNGLLAARLRSLGSVGQVIELDRAGRLLDQCRGPKALADEEALPLREASLDLVVSALSLQFVNDLPGALMQIRRALKPDGLFLGAMIGGATLTELREAFLAAEAEVEGGASPRVAPFADVRDAGALLQRAGFALPVADLDTVKVTYSSVFALMHELRGMGATNVLTARRKTPLRRATLLRMAEIYHARFSEPDGRIRATFEIVTMTGWSPHESQQKPLAPGSATARLADVLGPGRTKPG